MLPVDIYFPCNIAPALLPPRRGLVRVCYSCMFKEVLPSAPAAVSWLVDFFSHPLVLALVFFTGTLPPRQLLFVGVSMVLYGERTPCQLFERILFVRLPLAKAEVIVVPREEIVLRSAWYKQNGCSIFSYRGHAWQGLFFLPCYHQ